MADLVGGEANVWLVGALLLLAVGLGGALLAATRAGVTRVRTRR
jgi:hypothetical protein